MVLSLPMLDSIPSIDGVRFWEIDLESCNLDWLTSEWWILIVEEGDACMYDEDVWFDSVSVELPILELGRSTDGRIPSCSNILKWWGPVYYSDICYGDSHYPLG